MHGLGGDIIRTWSIKGKPWPSVMNYSQFSSSLTIDVFWPRDLLSNDIENARIISWGYDSNILNVISSSNQDTIVGHAETLLGDIHSLRFGLEVLSLFFFGSGPLLISRQRRQTVLSSSSVIVWEGLSSHKQVSPLKVIV